MDNYITVNLIKELIFKIKTKKIIYYKIKKLTDFNKMKIDRIFVYMKRITINPKR